MAKIHTESVVITFSKLVKESDQNAGAIASADIIAALASVAEELAGAGIVVEVESAQ